MIQLAPGWALTAEEENPNHWIGTCRDLALVFAYEGSHADIRHVHVAAAVIERLAAERHGPVKFLFVLPPHHSKPPQSGVRAAIAQVAPRLERHVSRVSVVVSGTGFGAAIHRGAIAGIVAVVRSKVPIKVVGTVREGLASLVAAGSPVPDEVARACERLSSGPDGLAAGQG